MSNFAEHNWYTLAFDADKVAEIIPEDYEYKNGKVWGGSDLSHAIEWMRKYNEHDRTLFRVSVSVEAVDVNGVSAPQPRPVNPWHESYGDEKVHMPKGYTDGERTRMIALRVAKDVGAIYGPDTATTVAELFDQHESKFDTEKMIDTTEESPQWWRWVFNTDTGYEEWVPSGLDYDTPEYKRMSTGVSVIRVWGTTADRDEKRDALLEADRKAGKQ